MLANFGQVEHKPFAKRFWRSVLLMGLSALFFVAIVMLYHPQMAA
jgi:hypothetical protein